MQHKEEKIDENTTVPLAWVWKAIAVAASILLLVVPVVAYAVSMQVKLDYTAKAVEAIPQMKEDIAAIKAVIAPQQTASAAPSGQTASRLFASDK